MFQHSIPFTVESYFMIWLYHRLHTHSPIEGYLVYFSFLAIMDKAIINILGTFVYCVFVWTLVHFSALNAQEHNCYFMYYVQDIYNFFFKCQTLSRVEVPFYVPTNNVWMTQFFHILTSIKCCHHFLKPFYRSVVIAHWGFNMHIPKASNFEHVFMRWFAIYIFYLVKCLFISFVHCLLKLFVCLLLLNFEHSL